MDLHPLAGAVVVSALAALTAVAPSAASAQGCAPPRLPGIVIVLDDSGSMELNDPDGLRATGAGAALRELGPGSVAAAVRFATTASPLFGPTLLDAGNVPALTDSIGQSLRSSGSTSFGSAFREAKRQLDAMPAEVDRKAVILLSDGQPTESYDTDQAISAAGIGIYTIGIGTTASPELDDIAQRSGGVSAYAATVEEAQGALARAVAQVKCQPVNAPEAVTLAPGGTRDVDFAVPAGTGSFTALAVWGVGTVTARLVRPDGSVLGPGATLPMETFEEQPTLARATSAGPAPGGWKVRLTAGAQNPESIKVSVELFGAPTLEHPLTKRPDPAAPGCETEVRVLDHVAWSRCLQPTSGGWKATLPVRIAGLDIEPRADGILLSNSGRITGKGRLFVTTSGPILGGGEMTLADGTLDLPLAAMSLLRLDEKRKTAPRTVGGLPVVGEAGVQLSWAPEGAKLKLALSLGGEFVSLLPPAEAVDPAGAGKTLKRGFGLDVELATTNERGLALDRIDGSLDAGKLYSALAVQSLRLSYDAVHNVWDGGATVVPFGGPLARHALPSVAADVGFSVQPFGLNRVKVVVTQINRPIGGSVFLQKLGGEIRREPPPFTLSGEIGLSAGPKVDVPGVGALTALELDGAASYSYPARLKASGGLKLLGQGVADGNLELNLADASGSLSGKAAFEVGGNGIEGKLDGWLADRDFQLTGDVGIDVFGKRVSGGSGFLSSRGMGGCRRGFGPDYGWTVEFGKSLPGALHVMASSCGFGALKVSPRAAQAGGRRDLDVAGGLLVRIAGAGGAPAVALHHGAETYEISAGLPFVETPAYTAIRDEAANVLWLVLNPSAQRRWSVEPLPGSAALEPFGLAQPVPRSSVRGGVRRSGSGYVLRWHADGQAVRFVERGPAGLTRTLLSTRRKRGSLRFRPAAGPAGARWIEATVLTDGLPAAVRRVGRYTTRTIRPARPRIALERRRRTVTISWRAVPAASAYRVDVRFADGRRVEQTLPAGRRSLRLRDVARATRARIVCRAQAANGTMSRAAAVSLR